MGARVIVGLQWGDEGKGKLVDYLTQQADAVVRFQGGHNAGHTIYVNEQKIVLHLLPSGVLHPGVDCYIANGVVLSIKHLFEEIAVLEQKGIELRKRLFISPLCPLLLSCHQAIDEAREDRQAKIDCAEQIGTTKRGIGPAYEDKVARRGLRLADIANMDVFSKKLHALFDYHNFLLKEYYHYPQLVSAEEELEGILKHRDMLLSMMKNVSGRLVHQSKRGKQILYEGAQGSMLDIDHGTYPFVTSSNTIASNVGVGCGINTDLIDEVIGVSKAYATRVGAGPFPSEINDDAAHQLAQKGKEKGATTGRARRCGWLDLVALKYAIDLNGVTRLCLTKLDVLGGMKELKICVGYVGGAGDNSYMAEACETYQPIYANFETWQEDISSARSFADLPLNAQEYVRFIEEYVAVPIDIISVGPERDSNIVVNSL